MWIVKAEPLDPYYQYGDMYLYVDKLSMKIAYNVKYNRAGEYWKTMVQEPPMYVIPDSEYAPSGHAFNVYGSQCVVDDRSHHCMGMPVDNITLVVDSPNVHPRNHTPQNLRTMTK